MIIAANIRLSCYIKINLATNHYIKLLCSSESFEVKYNIGFGITIQFTNQRIFFLLKSVHKQENWTFVVQLVI